MKLTNDELKNKELKELILISEAITLAANRLTELRLANNLTLYELEGKIDCVVSSALETKGVSFDENPEIYWDVKEYFFTLIDKFSGRCEHGLPHS